MSNSYDPPPSDAVGPPLTVIPVRLPPRPRSSPGRWLVRFLVLMLLAASVLLNIILILVLLPGLGEGESSSTSVRERYYAGKRLSRNKIAVVQIDGVLMESTTSFIHKEIERAATDHSVKAVVLRINSPGGSITASDDLHMRITELRNGNGEKKTDPKPVVVSMGGIAASGAYYISMPAQTLVAERTTLTGSIGVYAALPNVAELGNKIGFTMQVIKAGEVKDSGSPFKEMTAKEKRLWQDMVDRSYLQFLQVVEQGRPKLKGKWQEDILINDSLPVRGSPNGGLGRLVRYRADGGIFTAGQAHRYGLIDQIGYLDDAIQVVRQAANLGEDYRAVLYERPLTLFGLLGAQSQPPAVQFDPSRLCEAAVPRLWYLAPQSELAGVLAAMGKK